MALTIMAAVAMNGVIGNSKLKAMPWHCPEELKFFKENTMGKVIVMGRKTAQETGKLHGRDCLVVSRDPRLRLSGFRTVSLEQLLIMNEQNFDTQYVIAGGAEIYKELMPYASMASISYMDFEAHGDVFMPPLDRESWKKVSTIERQRFAAVLYANTARKEYSYNKSLLTHKKKRGGKSAKTI